ncbi:immunodominant staphylococcal antigen IsaB family protein [Staphylococcus americanisciuri]|uniref:Immunodominant staphylococcal antigen B n=1 Tax=Staphylococcus americanisciuri TaxID=2973940 RepID=A0ABT2EZV1_9STAP|nr:hypothetical protein [Staphylococcus americanisciuri]MCS4485734.1 hypothetical protein [Staphylococcus americanisciuri]
MNKYIKALVTTGVTAGLLLGGVSVANAAQEKTQTEKAPQKPYYSYKGVFNFKDNKALKDKYLYQALAADNFKYEGLQVGKSTKADADKALGKDLKAVSSENGISFYKKGDVILGFDKTDKLVDLVLLVDKVKDNEKDIKAHVNKEGFYDAGATQVSFFPGDNILINAKERVTE